MKKFRLIDSFYLTVLLGLVFFTVNDMKKPDCLEAQTCIPVLSTIVPGGSGSGNGSSSASCPGGTVVSGGGCACAANDAQLTDSYPSGNTWNCRCEDTESDNPRMSTAYILCARP